MTANLVEHLIVSGATKNVVGFFFCRYDEVESLKARTIIGSLARQLFDAVSTDVSVDKLCAFNDDLPLDVDQIVDFLREALPKDRQYFMVLDGLDECEEEEAKLLIANLQNLLTSADQVFKIYCSTRPDVFQWTNAMLAPRWHFSMSLANIGSEIADFIESTLEHCLELGTLRLGEPELIVAIQDALLEGAQGMFLWVAFQIPSICAQRNDEGILRTLRDLPKDLPETFDRVLRRIRQSKSTGSSHCQKIFKWIAATKRPLSTEELREAICLEPFQSAWNPRQLDNDITGTLASCGSLVMIDEEQLTVHFAHHSVKQHLLSTASDESFAIFHFDLAEADREVGAICVTYLSLGIFESQIAKTRHSNLNAADVPAVVVSGALPQNIVSKLAIRYLKNRQSVQSPVQRQLEDVAGVTESQRLQHIQQQFPFLQYARDYWLLHTKEAHIESRLSVMWRRLLESDDGVADKPWTKREMEHLPKRFVDWVVEHEHSALLERIIVGFVHTSGLGHNRLFRFTTVLETALQEKRKDFARKVILCNIPAQDIRDKLFFPIVRGGGDLDMLILNCKMGGNLDKTFTTEDQDTLFFLDRVTHWYFKDGTEFTLLELAAALGHSHIVKYVLFASPLQPVEIAFLVAAESEQREIMMMLIESHRIDPKWECRSWSALFYIARYGTLEMANRFIESIGNNLYPPWYHISHDGETADMVARRYRNIDVEKAILDVQDPWWKANWREVRMAPSKPGIKRHEVDKINKGFFEEGEFLKLENKWHYKKDRGGLIR
ncbi:hypothetical protein MMC12_008214 [Toensbergia leucococca]|nr:hypothetical protein [Toensbergia leucococca]